MVRGEFLTIVQCSLIFLFFNRVPTVEIVPSHGIHILFLLLRFPFYAFLYISNAEKNLLQGRESRSFEA